MNLVVVSMLALHRAVLADGEGCTHAATRLPRPKPAGLGVRPCRGHIKWPRLACGDRGSPN
jgi:hypothetical protein